ncbi:MAG: Lrp/AsnC family transcriptional regulator [Promethearchaeota archaeon]
MVLSDQFGLDEIDKNIITLLQKDPNITHSEIAKKIGRSQPAVGSRIHKLEEKGIISSQFGLNFKTAKVYLVKVELSTKKPEEIFEMGDCPFIINAMKLSGENNVMIFLASSSLKKIDAVVDYHFRNKDYITNIRMDVITDYLKDFVLPIDFEMDEHEPDSENGCGSKCTVARKQLERKKKT